LPLGLLLFAATGLAVFHPDEERDPPVARAALHPTPDVVVIRPPSLAGLTGQAVILLYRSVRWAWRWVTGAGPQSGGLDEKA